MIARMSSGSSRADIAVEPTRSQNITVSCRRSAASAVGMRDRRGARMVTADRGRNRLEQPLAVAERHAELFEVALGQFRQDFGVDRVFAKGCLVLTEPQARSHSPRPCHSPPGAPPRALIRIPRGRT